MSVIDKFKDLVGIEEEYDEDDFDAEEEEYGYDRKTVETRAPLTSQSRYGGSDNVVSMQNRTVKAITSTFKLMVIEPKGFDECSKLVDSLKSRKPIIVNLENSMQILQERYSTSWAERRMRSTETFRR